MNYKTKLDFYDMENSTKGWTYVSNLFVFETNFDYFYKIRFQMNNKLHYPGMDLFYFVDVNGEEVWLGSNDQIAFELDDKLTE